MPRHRTITNFGGNVRFAPRWHYEPADEAELLDILARHRGQNIRAIGSLHSWSEAAQTEAVLIDLRRLSQVQIETRTGKPLRATVGAGCKIKRLVEKLRRGADAIPASLGLINEQTLAGAISTGTHGSGKHSLSHYVRVVRLAGYDANSGEPVIRTLDCGAELQAARCSLGALGIIVSVIPVCIPSYRIEEHFARYSALDEVLAAEDRYPLQQFFFVPWQWEFFAQHRRESDAPASRTAGVYRAYWFVCMDLALHLVICLLARGLRSSWITKWFFRRLLPQLVIRHWKVIDRADRMLCMEHELFRHIEMELFVTRERLAGLLKLVRDVLEVSGSHDAMVSAATLKQLEPWGLCDSLDRLAGRYCHHYPICIRKVLPDATLISPASGTEPVYAVSLISYQRPDDRDGFFDCMTLLARAAAALFEARLHWGKFCPLEPQEIARLYPQLEAFREIARRFDRQGVFRNDWVSQILGFDDGSKS